MEKGFSVKKSKNGKGIFALKSFLAHRKLFRIKGKILRAEYINKIGGTYQDNTYRFGPETYLSPEGYIGDFLNHSCNPNARIVKRGKELFVYSYKDIKRGEEILIDYSTILAEDDTWVMPSECKCGSARCRKTIKRFTSFPKTLLEEYLERDLIPLYILKISNMA